VKLAINASLSHAPCDQLGVLRAKVEDQNFLVHGLGTVIRIRYGMERIDLQVARYTDQPNDQSAQPRHARLLNPVIGRFFRDLHIMHVGFAHAGMGNFNEFRLVA